MSPSKLTTSATARPTWRGTLLLSSGGNTRALPSASTARPEARNETVSGPSPTSRSLRSLPLTTARPGSAPPPLPGLRTGGRPAAAGARFFPLLPPRHAQHHQRRRAPAASITPCATTRPTSPGAHLEALRDGELLGRLGGEQRRQRLQVRHQLGDAWVAVLRVRLEAAR